MGRTGKNKNTRGVVSAFEGNISPDKSNLGNDVLDWYLSPMAILNDLRKPNSAISPDPITDADKDFSKNIEKNIEDNREYLSNFNNYKISNYLSPDEKREQIGYNTNMVWRVMSGTPQTNKVLNEIFVNNFKKSSFSTEAKDLISYLKNINSSENKNVLNNLRIKKIEKNVKSLLDNKTAPWKFSINAQTAGEKLSFWNGGKYKQMSDFATDLAMINRNATLANRRNDISNNQRTDILQKTNSLMYKIQKTSSSLETAKSFARTGAFLYEATPKAKEEMKTYFKEYFSYDNPYR